MPHSKAHDEKAEFLEILLESVPKEIEVRHAHSLNWDAGLDGWVFFQSGKRIGALRGFGDEITFQGNIPDWLIKIADQLVRKYPHDQVWINSKRYLVRE